MRYRGAVAVLWITDDRFLEHDTGRAHPERPARLRAVVEGVRQADLGDALVPAEPRMATNEGFLSVHHPSVLDSVQRVAQAGGGRLVGAAVEEFRCHRLESGPLLLRKPAPTSWRGAIPCPLADLASGVDLGHLAGRLVAVLNGRALHEKSRRAEQVAADPVARYFPIVEQLSAQLVTNRMIGRQITNAGPLDPDAFWPSADVIGGSRWPGTRGGPRQP